MSALAIAGIHLHACEYARVRTTHVLTSGTRRIFDASYLSRRPSKRGARLRGLQVPKHFTECRLFTYRHRTSIGGLAIDLYRETGTPGGAGSPTASCPKFVGLRATAALGTRTPRGCALLQQKLPVDVLARPRTVGADPFGY